jgi:Ca-activated chloride channel homolog
MTTEPLSPTLTRAPLDRRFLRVLGASALVVGASALGLVSVARHRDAALSTSREEARLETLRGLVRSQQTRDEEGGTGTRHGEGAMGDRSAPTRAARYAVRNNAEPPHLARESAQNRGIFAALGAAGGASAGIVSPFGGLTESSANGTMSGSAIGDAFGYGGLGTVGQGGGGYGAGSGSLHGRRPSNARASAGFAAPVAEQAVVTLDPNGRFATTYRPGHGHRAWFDAAVARGEIPETTRDLLADLGARAEPPMDAPLDHALDLRVDLERSALAPAGGDLRMRLALRSSNAPGLARPLMSVHLVMDVSGSMAGASMANARLAAEQLVAMLSDTDHFSLTTFESEAHLLVTEGTVGSRRDEILRTIRAIDVAGGTNISAGLAMGYRMAAHGPDATRANRLVMLISDGEPTDGETDRNALASLAAGALQDGGTETTSVGVGTSYDGALMSAIADLGAGGYYYVPDSARIGEALRAELESRAMPVAQAVEVRVKLAEGVQLTEAYGSRRLDDHEASNIRAQELALDGRTAARDHIARDRQRERRDGMRFFIPGFARDDRHAMLFGVRVPEGLRERAVATIELRYKDRVTGRNVTVERPVRVAYAPSEAASAATVDPSVARTVQSFEAGRTLADAALALGRNDQPRAVALLTEREQILRSAATRLSAPSLSEDADRLGRVRALLGGTNSTPAMVLAMLLDASARGLTR